MNSVKLFIYESSTSVEGIDGTEMAISRLETMINQFLIDCGSKVKNPNPVSSNYNVSHFNRSDVGEGKLLHTVSIVYSHEGMV